MRWPSCRKRRARASVAPVAMPRSATSRMAAHERRLSSIRASASTSLYNNHKHAY